MKAIGGLCGATLLVICATPVLATGRGYYGGHDGEIGLYLLVPFILYGLWILLNDQARSIYGWMIVAGAVALGSFYKGLLGAGDGAYIIGILATFITMLLYFHRRRR